MTGMRMRKSEREALENCNQINSCHGRYFVDNHTLQVYNLNPEKRIADQIKQLYTDLNKDV